MDKEKFICELIGLLYRYDDKGMVSISYAPDEGGEFVEIFYRGMQSYAYITSDSMGEILVSIGKALM